MMLLVSLAREMIALRRGAADLRYLSRRGIAVDACNAHLSTIGNSWNNKNE
jgi:hypothetical protein